MREYCNSAQFINAGPFLIVGPTTTGKTYLSKNIIKKLDEATANSTGSNIDRVIVVSSDNSLALSNFSGITNSNDVAITCSTFSDITDSSISTLTNSGKSVIVVEETHSIASEAGITKLRSLASKANVSVIVTSQVSFQENIDIFHSIFMFRSADYEYQQDLYSMLASNHFADLETFRNCYLMSTIQSYECLLILSDTHEQHYCYIA